MASTFLSIVTVSAPGDGRSVPRWVGGHDVELDMADGLLDTLAVSGVADGVLEGGIRISTRLTGLSARAHITDARTVIVVRRFESKGGGWIGFGSGALVAVVFNIVSKARVAARGAGRAAVGHIRHDRLAFVGWRSRNAGGSANEVRLGVRGARGDTTVVELTIPSDLDPALVAVEISRRAARWRLRHEPATEELIALADAPPTPPVSGGFATVRFPPAPEGALT